MNTLVVGGGGFIGQHLVKLLQKSHRKIFILGRSKQNPFLDFESVQYFSIFDYQDFGLKHPALQIYFDEVIDIAYTSVPKTSYDDPLRDITDNLPRFVQLLQFAAKAHCKKFVFLSSGGTVYGHAKYLPILESHTLEPISPYGITKLATEKYASMYSLQLDLPVICLRPSNVYGEGQMPYRGQGFIPTALASILQSQPITIFGDKGTIRDYIHVSDVANAIYAVLDDGKVGHTYNVSSGMGLSNFDIIKILQSLFPALCKQMQIKNLPSRNFDVSSNILSSEKLKLDTNWQPMLNISDGLFQTLHWLQNILSTHNKSY